MRETPDLIRERQAPATDASPATALIRFATFPWGEQTWLRVYSVGIAVAALLSFTGAVSTGELPLWTRLTYWLVTMLGGTIAMQMVSAGLDRFVRLEPMAEAIVQFMVATPVITLVVWLLTAAFNARMPNPVALPAYLGPVVCITAFMSGLQYLMHRHPQQSHDFQTAAPDTPSAEPAGAFRARLPFKFRQADIYALSGEDHYLRVYTSAGEALILMRLYDAIRELDGIEGSQTHRSWWVAKEAVSDVLKTDGRISLILKDGLTAPVSRSYQRALKQHGWL